jgi:hypothetical protein
VQADPDVLIVDEVLAVGDLSFQMKCFDRMQEIRNAGATVLVVSHNLNAVRRLSDRAILMHKGRQQFEGDTSDAISRYHELLQETRELEGDVDTGASIPIEGGYAELVDAELLGTDARTLHHFQSGQPIRARVSIKALRDVEAPFLGLMLTSGAGIPVYVDSNRATPYPRLRAGEVATYEVQFQADLVTGSYTLGLILGQLLPGDRPARFFEHPRLEFYTDGRAHVSGLADLGATFASHNGG